MTRYLRDIKLELEIFVFVIGLILFIIGSTGIFMPEDSPGFLKSIHADIGGWIYWGAAIGLILLVVSGWYMVDNLRKRREFEKLIKTKKKMEFIKNQERTEFLAWTLTTQHEQRLFDKKEEFGIKT